MKSKRRALALILACLLAAAAPAFAHHAWRGFDNANRATIKGTVTNFDWGNPHVWIYMDVTGDKGAVQKWSTGGPSPSRMANTGWDKNTLKPGDQIAATGVRANDGTYVMRLEKVNARRRPRTDLLREPVEASSRIGFSLSGFDFLYRSFNPTG